MESPAAIGKIFRCVAIFNNKDASFINHFPVGMVIAFTLKLLTKGVSMITSMANAGSYLRPAQAYASRTLTRADALPAADADATAGNAKAGIPVSDVKKLDMTGLKIVSIRDNPELRDLIASNWLRMHAVEAATEVSDDAPQNTYATVKVDGKVVATLYNGGSVTMTNQAAAMAGDLQDPPGLNGGPDLAQWRAEHIAKAVGGTIEKASTAITQSGWKPRETTSPNYTREQLDAAFEAMIAEQQMATVRRTGAYPNQRESSGTRADYNA
jgi:hypothetical protein